MLLILAVCAVLALFAFALLRRDAEPTYHRKSLSQWLEPRAFSAGRPGAEAVAATQAIGTNALPTLLRWLDYKPGLITRFCTAVRSQIPLPSVVDKALRRLAAFAPSQEKLWIMSLAGFRVLGTNAAPAIPQLARLATNINNGYTAPGATMALGSIGPPALPELIAILTNPKAPARALAVAAVAPLSSNAPYAASLIWQCLYDHDTEVSHKAESLLGTLSIPGDFPISVLTAALHSPNPHTQGAALRSLGNLGAAALIAVPQLQAALLDLTRTTREAATNALLQIAPEALTNALAQ